MKPLKMVQGSVKYYLKGKDKIKLGLMSSKEITCGKVDMSIFVASKGCQINIWKVFYGKNSEAQK